MKEKEGIDIRLTNDSITWNLVVEVEKFIGRPELMPHMSGKTAYCSSSTSIKCSHSDLIGLVSLASITINELIEKNWASVETLEKVVEFLGVTYVLGEEGREYIGWQKDGTKNKKK